MASPQSKTPRTQTPALTYTGATALLEALNEAGVTYLFANFGSDHPAIVEALAQARAAGDAVPQVITCPNEFVAMSAANGYAQVTGQAQAVLVHVECGTQSLGGAVHNAAKGRVPVLVIAGASPFTQEGELKGSRNEFIHWLQDVPDQRGIVRGYMKYDNEIRTARNMKQMIHRALQIAHSDPPGPVYLMAAREVLAEEVPPVKIDPAQWARLSPQAMTPEGARMLAHDLAKARRPLAVTSYAGRNPKAVEQLVRLCERVGMGVYESSAGYLNFPADHPLYQGSQGNEPVQNRALAEADVVLVLDSDVPWIPLLNQPSKSAKIYHIDVDPLKERTPLWYIPAAHVFRADVATALAQVAAALDTITVDHSLDGAAANERRSHYARLHGEWQAERNRREQPRADGTISAEYLTARVREHIGGDAIVLNESITNYTAVNDHIGITRAGMKMTSNASSLGWNGGAAIGAKLALPDRFVAVLTGDGSYMFSQPSTVHWIARQYKTPFLTVIYNNRGWRAPKFSMLAQYSDGYASQAANEGGEIGVTFDPPPDYAGIAAAAGGALALTVKSADALDAALAQAVRTVKEGQRSAVVDVWLPRL
ncbi:MAG TPA: thiamine pyrophosphate-requiring protein [Bryobacteraceae bacterium]|nr:thiamine pyrophosphate-requiring protein [Bryobacteraceae bacterium]